ncbi:hypothetical protein [Massilia sp. CCM 8734]|uniref:hypothetical protein n=1 Tax=Massilia sp. CCM 8734 TaxID=2609283 RepID=UPI0014205189|nr:hypothetical protein [Massilia sp. CCM 8734]NHZ97477.1 hypothetical protein [Massilia sp. CCM 8734]
MENVNYVFFGEDFAASAPELFGMLAIEPGCKWVTIAHLTHAVENGATVNVRQLSATELNRCEAILALRGIGEELAKRVAAALDDSAADPTAPATIEARKRLDPLEGKYYPMANLLDNRGAQ